MSRSANVLSVQALKDFKNAMINFGEEARNALSGVDMELRRMRDWLERDQLGYWQAQVKRRSEEVMQARSDLHRRKITQQGSDAVSDAEQKEALREATRRLRVAEDKVALIKRLIPALQRAIAEYHSHSQPLGDHLSGGFERSLASLERMIAALDAYLATAVPTAPQHESTESTSTATAAAGASRSDGLTTTTPAEPSDSDGPAAVQGTTTATTTKPAGSPGAAPESNATAAAASEPLVSGRTS
jgi:hypothetical protein